MSQSQEITAYFYRNLNDPEEWVLDGVDGDDEPHDPASTCLTSAEWFREEWGNTGHELLPEEMRDNPAVQEFWLKGYCWCERVESIDYGYDYDGGFEITDWKDLTDESKT